MFTACGTELHRAAYKIFTGASIDTVFDSSHIRELLERNALAQETMSAERLFAVKEKMEMAEARRLQPYFVRSFFTKAFEGLGGAMYPREQGRWEITHVTVGVEDCDSDPLKRQIQKDTLKKAGLSRARFSNDVHVTRQRVERNAEG
jgi:hypothetical protein